MAAVVLLSLARPVSGQSPARYAADGSDLRARILVVHAPAPGTAPAVARHAPPARPLPDPDDCFMCHDDETLTMEKGRQEISLYVSPDEYAGSAHREVDCVQCHTGFDPDEIPHKDPIGRVDCAACHASPARAFQQGPHSGDLACSSCHGDVHEPPTVVASITTCQRCHDDEVADLEASVHASGNDGPNCLDCHTPHAARSVSESLCMDCHSQKVDTRQQELVLDFENSIHGDVIACSDCHGSHRVLAASDSSSAVARRNVADTCAECHDDVAAEYLKSEHGKALLAGFDGAPSCTDCHGEHDIHQVTNGGSRVSREHEVDVCLSCHLDAPDVRDRMTHSSAFVAGYAESVHGRAFAAGNTEAAVCSDCHGAHQAMKASDPDSRVNKFNLASTCGTCHEDIEDAFVLSIHGTALGQGNADAPTCTDCHGEHAIFEHERAESPVAFNNVSEEVCSPCHSSVKMSEKYGFPSDRLSSFGDSYHGLAGKFGSQEAANCASCHGVHDILPSTDPRSKVNKANLSVTCGQCHPGANANFARGSVHVIRSPQGDRALYWISRIYLLLIIGIIGAMALHNAMDWGRKLRNQFRKRLKPDPTPIVRKTRLYVRMTANERIQHGLLASSFIILVITGFMLKFPEAWWVVGLRDLFGEGLFETRGLVHRIAAVVMVSVSVYHLYYVFFTERGRRFVRDIMLRGSDFKEMVQMIRYNMGLAKERPRFARFNYIEKSEYWALVWGTVVMTVTGVALWFENQFMSQFSKLFVDINETIHYFEAWLAFLAIVVWHFYYVIFNPDVYPMNFTWLTGRITEEEMEHEHPRELDRILEAEEEEEAVVEVDG